jgi:hypothetical protein
VESNGSSKETRRKEGSTKETRRKEGSSKEEITFSDYITFFEQLVMQVPVTVSDSYPFSQNNDLKKRKNAPTGTRTRV